MKRPHPFIFIGLLLITATFTPAIAQKSGRDRVLKIDAVELIDRDKEIEGKVEFQQQHGRYLYLFANAENLTVFKANPAKYEIQLGGACGRMGPLSGEGSPKIFAVHDGRLYIFASEQCKRSFVAAPEKLLELDDEPPATTDESLKRGRALLDRAVDGVGGAAKLDALVSYREGRSRQTESGGKPYTVTDTVALHLPDGVYTENCWNDQCWGYVVMGSDGWTTDEGGGEALVPEQRIAVLRSAGRHPLALLRNRDRPGLVVVSDGSERTIDVAGEGSIDLDLLTLHSEGTTTTLGIDAEGRVRLLSYRGRGLTLGIGQIERIYSGFHDVGDLNLAGRVDVVFEGKPAPNDSGAFAVQTINDPADRARFERTP